MRKIIVLSFISLDGVMQGPGGPSEDTSGNFTYGGWTVPYFDDFLGQIMTEQMSKPFDLLLGRKTFEIFASYAGRVLVVVSRGGKYLLDHLLVPLIAAVGLYKVPVV